MSTEAQNQVEEQVATEAQAPVESAPDTLEGNGPAATDTEALSTDDSAAASTAAVIEATITGGEAA